jgi:hypothetical protein
MGLILHKIEYGAGYQGGRRVKLHSVNRANETKKGVSPTEIEDTPYSYKRQRWVKLPLPWEGSGSVPLR